MEDAKFLQQCGIEIDLRWLLEFMDKDEASEVCNHVKDLLRIGDMLGSVQVPQGNANKALPSSCQSATELTGE
jgi:hypothetical protein